MINLSRFSKMSFTELVSLPNYYIHEIYKLFVDDSIARAKREKEEKEAAEKRRLQEERSNNMNGGYRDSSNVQSLRQALAMQGLSNNDLEEFMDELDE